MTTQLQGFDLSFSRLTAKAADDLWGAGMRCMFQCLWTGATAPPHRIENLRVGEARGFLLGGYISVTSAPGSYHVEKGRDWMPQDLWNKLLLVPVDLEHPYLPPVEAAREAVDLLYTKYGKRRAVYTSFDSWVNHYGNPKSFTDCLLYNAFWDKHPDVDFPALPYGGWTPEQVFAEQWTGGHELVPGVEIDRDTFIKELLIPEEEEMSVAATELRTAAAKTQEASTGDNFWGGYFWDDGSPGSSQLVLMELRRAVENMQNQVDPVKRAVWYVYIQRLVGNMGFCLGHEYAAAGK